jgi:hypothetical protein
MSIQLKRKRFLKQLEEGKIKLYPYFDLKKYWPTHPLIIHIRKQIAPLISKILAKTNFIFDPQDLEHQVLFRLTTFPPSQLFEKGLLLEKYLEKQGASNDWQKIPFLDLNIISKFLLNQKIVQQVLKEQLLLIQNRINKANFSLKQVFREIKNSDKIFTRDENERYVLKWERSNGKKYLTAVKFNSLGKIIDSIPVEFRKIDKKLGRKFIQAFHYTHAPRFKEEIFGFFLQKSNFPFAIQTVNWAKNTPKFRQDALLIKGFNPECCIELRRLYTLPGSPRNIIGVLDSLIIRYFRRLHRIEAVITTVMPMYAKTRSTTIASGINKVLYVRFLSHKFIPRKINDKKVWEHIIPEDPSWTKTHQNKIIVTNPKFPTYPTIGVYKQIREKSYKEISFAKNKIIGFDF